MRRDSHRKFHREKNQRVALMRSLAANLIMRGKIKTTEEKAKELRPFVEKLVTKARENTLPARRILISRLHEPKVAAYLLETVAPKFKTRSGGYTRIVKLGNRAGDAGAMALISFVE